MSLQNFDQRNQNATYQTNIAGDAKIGQIGDIFNVGDIAGSYNAIGAGAQVIVNQIEQELSVIDEMEKGIQVAERRLARAIQERIEHHTRLPAKVSTEAQRNPYRELLNYRIEDAPFFYGRQDAINAMLGRLDRDPLTVLQADSGSGKTSLLQAGLAARLLAAKHLPIWVRPRQEAPHVAIKKVFLRDYQTLDELARFRDETMSLAGFLRRVTSYLGPRKLFIFLDQFEEFFDEATPEKEAFATQLQQCIDDTQLEVRWALSLREEYFAKLRLFDAINPFDNYYYLNTFRIEEAQDVITQPALKKGVSYEVGLVERIIADIAQGSDRLVPVHVQLVCSTLFDERDDTRVISAELYERERGVGERKAHGAQGIWRSHLSRTMRQQMSGREQRIAWQILPTLVTSKKQRTQRTQQAILEEIQAATGGASVDLHLADNVLHTLLKNRLLTQDEDAVDNPLYELAHDFLLDEIAVDPEALARKAAQEILDREVDLFSDNPDLRIPADKLDIIQAQLDQLHLNNKARTLLDLSRQALQRRRRYEQAGIITIIALIGVLLLVSWRTNHTVMAAQATTTAIENTKSALDIIISEQSAEVADVNAQLVEQSAEVAAASAQLDQLELDRIELERSFRLARAEGAARAASQAQTDGKPQLAALLALEAMHATYDEDGDVLPLAHSELQKTLAAMGGTPLYSFSAPPILSKDRAWLLIRAEQVRVWDMTADNFWDSPRVLQNAENIRLPEFIPDHSLIVGSKFRNPRTDARPLLLWDISTSGNVEPVELSADADHYQISDNGQWIAVADEQGTDVFALSQGNITGVPRFEVAEVLQTISFSLDGRWMAGRIDSNTVGVWDLRRADAVGSVRHLLGTEPSGSQQRNDILISEDGSHIFEGLGVFLGERNGLDETSTANHWRVSASEAQLEIIAPNAQLQKGTHTFFPATAVSPDRRWQAYEDPDNVINFIPLTDDITTMTQTYDLGDEPMSIEGIAFSHDGRWVTTYGIGSANRLWRVESDTVLEIDATLPFAGSGDLFEGNTLAEASEPLADERNVDVTEIAFSEDGQWLSRINGDSAELWHLAQPEPMRVAQVQGGDPITTQMATHWLVQVDETVQVYALDPQQFLSVACGWHDGMCPNLVPSLTITNVISDNPFLVDAKRQIIATTQDNQIHVWSLNDSDVQKRTLRTHDAPIETLLLTPNNHIVSMGGSEARVWDSLLPYNTTQLDLENLYEATFSANGDILAAWNENEVMLVDRTGDLLAQYELPNGDWGEIFFEISNQGNTRVFVGLDDRESHWISQVWHGQGNANPLSQPFVEPSDSIVWVWDVAVSHNGRWAARVDWETNGIVVKLWDLTLDDQSTPIYVESFEYVSCEYRQCLHFERSGTAIWLVLDSGIRQWDISKLQPGTAPHEQYVNEEITALIAAVDPNMRWLATDFGLYDLAVPTQTDPLIEFYDPQSEFGFPDISSLQFSNDGLRLAVTLPTKVLVYDLSDLLTDPVQISISQPLATHFVSDAYELIVVNKDGTIRTVNLDIETVMEQACQTIGRNIDPVVEWESYFGGQKYSATCDID